MWHQAQLGFEGGDPGLSPGQLGAQHTDWAVVEPDPPLFIDGGVLACTGGLAHGGGALPAQRAAP